ncbi:MAG: hypothetical protein P1P80_07725 [ANME-2 cluster archaeon]|nr:hypothetical protein [ANME-2 cluster archaeon]
MKIGENKIGTLSFILTVLIVIRALLIINSNYSFNDTIPAGSEEILWVNYLIKFYVAFSVIGLTANLILMHIKFTKMKGFHEG